MQEIFGYRSSGVGEVRSEARGRCLIALLALLLGLLALAPAAHGAGELDPTFDGDGRVVTDFGADDSASGIAVQADGRLVAAGSSAVGANPPNFALTRYNPDGSLDPTFGGDGRVVTDFGAGDEVLDVVIQADGKIVAAGESGPFGTENFALARYNPDGSLDRTFDGDGMVVTDLGGHAEAHDVAIQADGKILAAGRSTAGFSLYQFALARYNPDGSLDPTFDGDGRVLTDFGARAEASALAIQVDGKIVAAGFGADPPDFALARYTPNGGLDPAFGGDGKVMTDFGGDDRGFDGAIQADGRIVAGGFSSAGANPFNFALVRYDAGGRLDSSFAGDGRVLTDFGANEFALGVTIQADDKIVAAGSKRAASATPRNFALARYLPDGARPPSLDHFLYYLVENGTPSFQPRIVTIRDQFRSSRAEVVEPLRLLNPVSKDAGTIRRPDAHLKCYRIEEATFRERTVTVENQFGTQSFQVGQPTRLCNPASKKMPPGTPPPVPRGLDHFRCYGVEAGPLNRTVRLRDQFGRQEVMVEEPEYLCNPASKNGSPVLNPGARLVCYELEGADHFTTRRASLRDQFGVQTFTVVRPTKLCAPSRKRR